MRHPIGRPHVVTARHLGKLVLTTLAAGVSLAIAGDQVRRLATPPARAVPLAPVIETRTASYDLVKLSFEVEGMKSECELVVYRDRATWTLKC